MTLIRANKRIIGIDIGGSKTRAVLWDGKKVLATQQVKMPARLSDFRKEIIKLITWKPGFQVDQIGIGAAGIISGTKIVSSPNIKYLRDFDFAKLLGVRDAKLRLGNDAQCFARSVIGSANGKLFKNKTILAVTLGTGIGRGLAKNGKIRKIKAFEYPESWEKEYQKMRGKPKAVMSAEFADFLAEHLAPIAKKYNANAVVFGGGVTDRSGFWKRVKEAFKQRGWKGNLSISHLGKNAVAVGAALLK